MTETLKKTPLYDAHVEAGARLVPFAGYEMPVQYSGLKDEHQAVREAVGLFDVSHMGQVEVTGPEALKAVNRVITNDLEGIEDGQACYTVMCKPDGGIIDDLIVYRFSPEKIFIVVNAANREKDVAWMREQIGSSAKVDDQSDDWALIAVQGPKALELVSRLSDREANDIGRFRFVSAQVAERTVMIARTGYTGEDGVELYVPAGESMEVWAALLAKGADLGVKPIGLGARDSLRLEMKFPLYGNDIDEGTNPYEAGLAWTVKLKKADFVGKEKLEAVKADGVSRKLIGFEVVGRGIARPGYPVLVGGAKVSEVRSGTMSPSLGKAIGTAYLPTAQAKAGTTFSVEVRGRPVDAVVVKTPFYRKDA